MNNLLPEFPVVIELPVVWGEMDVYGHVNNIIYFRYFESVRITYFNRMGFLNYKEKKGIGPILAQTSCRFKIPLSYPDTVAVGARVQTINEDNFIMEYKVVSHTHQKVAAIGDGLIVCYNYHESKKAPIPDKLLENIRNLEK